MGSPKVFPSWVKENEIQAIRTLCTQKEDLQITLRKLTRHPGFKTKHRRAPNNPVVRDEGMRGMSKFQLSLKQTGLLVTGIGLGAITVLAGLMPDDGSQERVSIASITVEEIINKVEINSAGHAISAGDRDFVEAYIGLRLQAGDGVRTFQDSEARVDISIDDTVRFMRTTPNTLWRVGKFVANDGAVIELDGGRILVFDEETPDGRPPLQIITPAGTATARGTWMSIEVNPESGETVVQCFRGSCELANDQGVQLLSDQQ